MWRFKAACICKGWVIQSCNRATETSVHYDSVCVNVSKVMTKHPVSSATNFPLFVMKGSLVSASLLGAMPLFWVPPRPSPVPAPASPLFPAHQPLGMQYQSTSHLSQLSGCRGGRHSSASPDVKSQSKDTGLGGSACM